MQAHTKLLLFICCIQSLVFRVETQFLAFCNASTLRDNWVTIT